MSNVVPFKTHRYLDAELTSAVHRYPEGDWVSLDATTHARRDGHGTASGILSDRVGPIGQTIQSLVIDQRQLDARHSVLARTRCRSRRFGSTQSS